MNGPQTPDSYVEDVPADAFARVLRGILIRNARLRLGMTQQALAHAAGLTRQTIIAVEQRGTMSQHTRAQLECVLGPDFDGRGQNGAVASMRSIAQRT